MNKEEFEQMLGGEESAMRTNYLSLVGDVREFIDDIAMWGVFMMEFIQSIEDTLEQTSPATVQSMLQDLFSLQFLIVQNLGGVKLQHHHEYLVGKKLDVEDFKDAGSMSARVNRFINKYKGHGCDGVLSAFLLLLGDEDNTEE